MISQGAWIVALIVVLLGQRQPRSAMLWAGLGIALYAATAIAAPHPSWPYLGALLVLIAIGNVIRLTFQPGQVREAPMEVPAAAVPSGDFDTMIGTVAPVTKAIRGGFGMVMVRDDPWPVCADEDLPEGTRVQVIGVSGTYLMVARTD